MFCGANLKQVRLPKRNNYVMLISKQVIKNEYRRSQLFWKEEERTKMAMYKFTEVSALPLYLLRGKEYDLLQG